MHPSAPPAVYAEGTENFMTALACTELESGLPASQIGLGLPAFSSAAGSGYVSPTVVNDALDCLVTSEAGTWRSAFIAAATDRQLAAIRAATPADDADPMHKSERHRIYPQRSMGLGGWRSACSREVRMV